MLNDWEKSLIQQHIRKHNIIYCYLQYCLNFCITSQQVHNFDRKIVKNKIILICISDELKILTMIYTS
uniref:Uncharacterized protein n=1 Tax=Papilio xuthus TaxID=66420 RepID=I4DKK3_PAPXU|nr:unknown unsecreted protein [Papilio xuthus]